MKRIFIMNDSGIREYVPTDSLKKEIQLSQKSIKVENDGGKCLNKR